MSPGKISVAATPEPRGTPGDVVAAEIERRRGMDPGERFLLALLEAQAAVADGLAAVTVMLAAGDHPRA